MRVARSPPPYVLAIRIVRNRPVKHENARLLRKFVDKANPFATNKRRGNSNQEGRKIKAVAAARVAAARRLVLSALAMTAATTRNVGTKHLFFIDGLTFA